MTVVEGNQLWSLDKFLWISSVLETQVSMTFLLLWWNSTLMRCSCFSDDHFSVWRRCCPCLVDCLAVLASFVAIYTALCHGLGACPSVISLSLPLAVFMPYVTLMLSIPFYILRIWNRFDIYKVQLTLILNPKQSCYTFSIPSLWSVCNLRFTIFA